MSRKWSREHQEWPQWSPGQWPKENQKKKGAGKGGGKDQSKKAAEKLPVARAYDMEPSSSAPSSADGAMPVDGGMQEFFKQFTEFARQSQQPLPEKLKQMLPNAEREDIKEKQRCLNKLRNLRNKIESKQRSIKNDEAAWEKWLKEIKESIVQQRKQHEETQEKLAAELKQLQKEEEDLKNGQEEEVDQKMVEEEDPELLLDELLNKPPGPSLAKKEAERIQEMQRNMEEQYQIRMQAEREQMQKDFLALMHQMTMGTATGAPVVDLSKEEAAKAPTMEGTEMEAATAATVETQMQKQIANAKAALIPFGVARRAKGTSGSSPYRREEPVAPAKKEEEKDKDLNLEEVLKDTGQN